MQKNRMVQNLATTAPNRRITAPARRPEAMNSKSLPTAAEAVEAMAGAEVATAALAAAAVAAAASAVAVEVLAAAGAAPCAHVAQLRQQ
jgi:hypothetical protein